MDRDAWSVAARTSSCDGRVDMTPTYARRLPSISPNSFCRSQLLLGSADVVEGAGDGEAEALVLDVGEEHLAVGCEVDAGELGRADSVAGEGCDVAVVVDGEEVLGAFAVLGEEEPSVRGDAD